MFKLSRQQKDHRYFCGNRYEKYSIKKLKVGAASVLIGAGFLFGYNVDTVEVAHFDRAALHNLTTCQEDSRHLCVARKRTIIETINLFGLVSTLIPGTSAVGAAEEGATLRIITR